ncbi:hypothetical protein GBAR_LOCUS30873 [Geodia barretti]|uniref:Uncharacterized protein n=1 Tax=Geodia barretti TaxID=519541 RepID=A0AA35XF93_GEOBA|nr:hypothetical protein GBAR_LOCUS30873 [Geodia barretti]
MHISLLPLPPSLSYLSFPLPSPNPSLSLRSSTQLRCQWFRKPSLPVRRGWSGPHVSFLPSTTTNTLDSPSYAVISRAKLYLEAQTSV